MRVTKLVSHRYGGGVFYYATQARRRELHTGRHMRRGSTIVEGAGIARTPQRAKINARFGK